MRPLRWSCLGDRPSRPWPRTSSTRNLLPLVVAYLPVPIAGQCCRRAGRSAPRPTAGRATWSSEARPSRLPSSCRCILLGAAAVAPREGTIGRVGAGSRVGGRRRRSSPAVRPTYPNDFKAADAAGTPRRLTAALAAIHWSWPWPCWPTLGRGCSPRTNARAEGALRGPLDTSPIQPYGCTNADRVRSRHRLLRSRRRDATRHRPARPERPGGCRRAGRPLPDVVRRRPEACRRAGAGRPGHQGAHRSTQGRPDQHRGPPPGARSPRRVRSDVARSDRPHDGPHHTHGRRRHDDDRDRSPQGSGRPDDDPDRRIRRVARTGLGPLGGPAQARALVGSAVLAGDIHGPRPGAREPRRVPHDRSDRRGGARLLGRHRSRPAPPARLPRRVRRQRRHAER